MLRDRSPRHRRALSDVCAATGGNPFYLLQIVANLLESGQDRSNGRRWVIFPAVLYPRRSGSA